MTREDMKNFLISQKGKTKNEVLSNFADFVVAYGISMDKYGKLISDIKSYPEWTWGE